MGGGGWGGEERKKKGKRSKGVNTSRQKVSQQNKRLPCEKYVTIREGVACLYQNRGWFTSYGSDINGSNQTTSSSSVVTANL